MKHKRFLKNFFGLWFLFGPVEAGGFWVFGQVLRPPVSSDYMISFIVIMSLMGAGMALILAVGTWNLKEMN